jgi:hypothetical protein
MTTKETCPKCNSPLSGRFPSPQYTCGTRIFEGNLGQSMLCIRITKLEKENERFRNNRSEQCVNCMKYTTDWIEPDGAPGRICRSCETLLDKGGKTE